MSLTLADTADTAATVTIVICQVDADEGSQMTDCVQNVKLMGVDSNRSAFRKPAYLFLCISQHATRPSELQ